MPSRLSPQWFCGNSCTFVYIYIYFAEVNHNGEDDWEVRLIDQTDNVEELRKRGSFWQHELDTFQPNGLNEREVALF